MNLRRSPAGLLLAAVLMFQTGILSGQQMLNRFKADMRGLGKAAVVRLHPRSSKDTQIEQLAREIDWLEAHIDKFGSIVAKKPDVWGESRLTKFRSEYESELAKQLSCFEVRDNARIVRSDLAFLANATGISRAIDSSPATPDVNVNLASTESPAQTGSSSIGDDPSSVPAATVNQTVTISNTPLDPDKLLSAASNLEMTEELNQLSRYINHLHQLRRINSGDDTSDAPGYSLNLVRIPISISPGRETRRGYGARATITAEAHTSETLLPETFRSLVINDIVDQLALPVLKLAEDVEQNLAYTRAVQRYYAANRATIDRIKSVIRQVKHAAPEQVQMDQILELVFQQGSPVDNVRALEALAEATRMTLQVRIDHAKNPAVKENANGSQHRVAQGVLAIKFLMLGEMEDGRQIAAMQNNLEQMAAVKPFELQQSLQAMAADTEFSPSSRVIQSVVGNENVAEERSFKFIQGNLQGIRELSQTKQAVILEVGELFSQLTHTYYEESMANVNPVSRRRRTSMPIPQVLLEQVIGREELVEIALEFKTSYSGQMVAWNEQPGVPPIHLADVRHFLQSNLEGAYRMLQQPENLAVLRNTIEPGWLPGGLATSVNLAHLPEIDQMRRQFAESFSGELTHPAERTAPIMRSLAWPVVVEMALLNEQLNKDVHNIAITRGDCGCHPTQRHAYYLPMPRHDDEAVDDEFSAATFQFQEYVRCRWPIHVFQVDPVNEEQNVQESSTIGRELVIAAALGVSSGNMSFRQANQFVRQYQEQVDTIGLNRTISGFSHGSDTFGWTFRPRVQTHVTRGTIATFGETLLGRRADANLRDAAIEPGIRECTAIVLMPSFVPYCDFDIATNWFRLDNPRSTELSTHASVKLSRSIKQMQDGALACSQCAHLYRDGETDRLMQRVTQLERQLPLQSMRIQIPYENTLGGFELFSNGVTDLAPELVGWYGAPGIGVGGNGCCPANCGAASASGETGSTVGSDSCAAHATGSGQGGQGSGTSVFLVGDNFSVHETQVIAGGVLIPREHVDLISRQVIQVNVPRCVKTVELDGHPFVALHASTPYGVTGHLHVPAVIEETSTTPSPAVPDAVAQLEAFRAETQRQIDSLKQSIEQSPFAFSWTNAPTLPAVTSYQEVTTPEGSYQRRCIQLGNLAKNQPYVLQWSRPMTIPDFQSDSGGLVPGLQQTTRLPNAGMLGQFTLAGQNVGAPFWITGPDSIKIGERDQFQLVAVDLIQRIEGAVGKYLTIDKTGNEASVQIAMKTFIVFTERTEDASQLRLLGEPLAVAGEIPVLLQRRVNPPKSQQCDEPIPSSNWNTGEIRISNPTSETTNEFVVPQSVRTTQEKK